MAILKYANGIQPLPAIKAAIVQDSLSKYGIDSILITSTYRTPAQQAAAMYSNIEKTGTAAQYALYKKGNGGKIIDVYTINKAAKNPKDFILSEMTKKIISIGPETISAHCTIDPLKNVAFDIQPDSIPQNKRSAFIQALKAVSSKLLIPGITTGEPVFHAEMKAGFIKKAITPASVILAVAGLIFVSYKFFK